MPRPRLDKPARPAFMLPPLSALEGQVLRALSQPLGFAELEQQVLQALFTTPLELLEGLRSLERQQCIEFQGQAGVRRLFIRTRIGEAAAYTFCAPVQAS